MAYKIATLNIKGMCDRRKVTLLSVFLLHHLVDIIFLQETHTFSEREAKEIADTLGCHGFWSHGSNTSKGVGILITKRLECDLGSWCSDQEGRVVGINIKISDVSFTLINVYAPNEGPERKALFASLPEILRGNTNIILGGDFNCIENPFLDKAGGDMQRGHIGAKELGYLKQDFHLEDVFRSKFPCRKEYTWSNGNGVYCRLDRFYVNSDLLQFTTKTRVHHCSFSDHNLVVMEVRDFERKLVGPGFWKCNTSILTDPNLVSDMRKLWQVLSSSSQKDLKWWERCKLGFKNVIMKHSCIIARKKRENINLIEAELRILRGIEMQSPGDCIQSILFQEKALAKLLQEKVEGARLRAKLNQIDFDEKPSSYFFRREVSRGKAKTIEKLVVNDVSVSDQDGIKASCRTFYKDLFSSEPIDIATVNDFTDNLPFLKVEDKLFCEGSLTAAECYEALKGMKDGKSPGLDGLPKEFYVHFFPLFGKDFVRVMNNAFEQGFLSPSQRRGVITLICKDDSRREHLECWRPITLLTVDYKIISKSITNRLSKVLASIIGQEQTCAVPGRSITDQLHLIRSLFDYVELKSIPCGILNLDQAKAFDRVSHEYMFLCLQKYGFGPDFISWVKLLYSNIESCVQVNGFITDSFRVERSVRQGCGLSPLLYVLCIEPLTRMLCLSPNIQGANIPGFDGELKVIQYADDTTVIVKNEFSVKSVLEITDKFKRASGAKLNKYKCKGMWFGSLSPKYNHVYGINFTHNTLKMLGIYFSRNPEVLDSINWNPITVRFGNVLEAWQYRHTTYRGRALLANTFACSKLWYVGKVLQLDRKHLKIFNAKMFNFIWKGQDRVRRTVMISDFTEGGQKVIHIPTKLKSFRIMHVIDLIHRDVQNYWTYFAVYFIGFHLRKWKKELGRNTIPHCDVIPPFYKESLADFKDFCKKYPDINLQLMDTKQVYSLLLCDAQEKPSVSLRNENVFVNFDLVWKNTHHPFLCPSLRDLNWRVSHDVLPVNEKLHRDTPFTTRTDKCPLCNIGVEDTTHLFLLCPFSNPVLEVVESIIKDIVGVQVLLDRNAMLFNILPKECDKFVPICLLLISTYKDNIWFVRCKILKERKQFTANSLMNLILAALKFRFKVDLERLKKPNFKKLWSCNGAICSFANESWTFNL